MLRTPGLLPLLLATTLLAATVPVAHAQPTDPLLDLALEEVARGLSAPTAVVHSGDPGDSRLFVTERAGTVRIVRDVAGPGSGSPGTVEPEPFLDLRDRVGAGGERGLLSLAFHPRYAETGWFYVDYTDLQGDTVVARFRVSPADPDRARPGSERVLLRIAQPFANHNGGQLRFGPDGHLYVGMGDGGSAFDPQCRAQDPGSRLGKILRLDVGNGPSDPWTAVAPWYRVPADNPFVGEPGAAPEAWALGLRNPWRFSFDRATGDLWLADVGQGEREEVDFVAATGGSGAGRGANFGWKMLEGTLCLGSSAGCEGPLPPCGSAVYTPPVVEYGHQGGRCSVTGGFVYRGGRIAGLDGTYLYGDFCSGEVFAARPDGAGGWAAVDTLLRVPGLSTFGEGPDGDLFLAGLPGVLHRLSGPPLETAPCTADATTHCLAGERFRVEATFHVDAGPSQPARAVPLSQDTGLFWFFDADNLELVVKVLDGCAVNERWWVFAAGLTNVGTELVVRDLASGRERRYPQPSGAPYPPILDTQAFPCGGS